MRSMTAREFYDMVLGEELQRWAAEREVQLVEERPKPVLATSDGNVVSLKDGR